MRHVNSTFRTISLWIAMLPSMALADPAQDLFKNVLDNARLCSYWNNDAATRADCFIKAAPQKCEAEAMKFLATQNRELFFCVASCVNAGVASRSFGECSRELNSESAGVELAEMIAQQEKEALAYYWARANEANDEVLKLYPYLTAPQNKTDQTAVSNFEYLKKQYLTVNADPREAVYRSGRETDAWRSLAIKAAQKKNTSFQSSAPMTSEMVDAVLGNTPPRIGGSAPSGPSADDIHFQKIYAAHPDAISISEDPAFWGWAYNNPETKRIADAGTADEVITLFNAYKSHRANQRATTIPVAIAPIIPYPDCVIRPVMTNDDYRACGITPPSR